jgi:O-antigen/teichoic acid export membrane protein
MSVARDTTYSLAASFVPLAVTIVTTPLFIAVIGVERFGLLAICWTLLNSLSFASLGMAPALAVRLAAMESAPAAERSEIVWTALLLTLAVAVVGSAVLYSIGYFYFGHFPPVASVLKTEVQHSLPLFTLAFVLGLIIAVLNAALQGRQLFGWQSILLATNSVLLSVTPLAFAYLLSARVPSLALAMVVGQFATLLAQLAICRDLIPLKAATWPKRETVNSLLDFGLWMSLTRILAPLVTLVDRFLIGALRGPVAVSAYVLPYGLALRLVMLPGSLYNATLPRFAAFNNPDDERKLQSESIELLNGILTPAGVFGIALMGPFLRVWLGESLGSAAAPVGVILMAGAWAHAIGYIPSAMLLGQDRPQIVTKLLLGYLAPYIALLYILTLRFGAPGAAIAWALRAATEPSLFFFTKPAHSEVVALAQSAALLILAMLGGLLLSWESLCYWVVMTAVAVIACYRSRHLTIALLSELRRADFGLAS